MTSLIPTRQLNFLAQLSGLVRRRRKVEAMALFWTIVLGFGGGRARTLAGMRRAYQKSTGATLVPSAFYDRFTRSLAVFFRRLVEELLERLQDTEDRFAGVLQSFRDVLMTESTLVKLHDLLEKRFPACRTNHTKAAAKLHVVMSARGQGPRSVNLTSGRQHDGPVFRVGCWVRDRLLLSDLGYFRYQLFDRIDRNGGYFISRLKEDANPRSRLPCASGAGGASLWSDGCETWSVRCSARYWMSRWRSPSGGGCTREAARGPTGRCAWSGSGTRTPAATISM